ncbi:MAG: type II secretion system protein GspG [Phycisphaerales bacterium]|nr:type II secretion system protein GspG [Phycisphaerales bacterium]
MSLDNDSGALSGHAGTTSNAAERRNERSLVGSVGLGMVVVATVGSPACFLLPCPLLLLVPVRPRWCGAVGLLIGTLCLAAWTSFFWTAFAPALAGMRQYNLTAGEYVILLMRSQGAVELIELRRKSDGTPPASLAKAGVTGENLVDAWNRPLRYVINPAKARGYELVTIGKDGIPGTQDDIDLISIPRNGFELAPMRRSRATGSESVPPAESGG